MTLTLEGSADEVQQALRTLAGIIDRHPARDNGANPVPTSPWTAQEAKRLWRDLAPEARRILKELGKRPESYPQTELAKSLGLNAREIGGRLSSVGHALRKLPQKPHPVVRERVNNALIYRLDPEVAHAVQALGQ